MTETGKSEVVWRPTPEYAAGTRIARFMRSLGIGTLAELQRRSVADPDWYWDAVVRDLGLRFTRPYTRVRDVSRGLQWPRWFEGGLMNFADNCVDRHLDAGRGEQPAIVWEGDDGRSRSLTYRELAAAQVKWYRPPSYYKDSPWRGTRALDGGGALMNQGVHTVDLLLWLFGPVRRVFAKTAAKLHAIEVEDTAVAVLEFENGALGTLEAATSAYPGYSRRLELTGSNGTLILDGDDLTAIDLKDARADERPTRPGGVTGVASATVSAASPVVADASAHTRVFEDFIHAVSARTAPSCDGRSARQSVALIEAIYASARTDRPVALP
jgi:hypothetical protein